MKNNKEEQVSSQDNCEGNQKKHWFPSVVLGLLIASAFSTVIYQLLTFFFPYI